LVIDSTLEFNGYKDDLIAVQATINIHNPSKSKAYVHADYFNIRGVKVNNTNTSDNDYRETASQQLEKKSYTYLSRFTPIEKRKVVFSGKIFDWPGIWWLEPDENLTAERIFFVPNYFDFLEMTVVLSYSEGEKYFTGIVYIDPTDLSIKHKILFSDSNEEFNWENKAHLAIQKNYRNAEIFDEAYLTLSTRSQ